MAPNMGRGDAKLSLTHLLCGEPAIKLQRREPHRMLILAWSINRVGIRPRPCSSSTTSRSEYEPRAANPLDDVVNQQVIVLPELKELSARGMQHQLGTAISLRVKLVVQPLEELTDPE